MGTQPSRQPAKIFVSVTQQPGLCWVASIATHGSYADGYPTAAKRSPTTFTRAALTGHPRTFAGGRGLVLPGDLHPGRVEDSGTSPSRQDAHAHQGLHH